MILLAPVGVVMAIIAMLVFWIITAWLGMV